MNKEKTKYLIILHILLMVYSCSTICSKMAAGEEFLSLRFCFFYGGVIFLLGVYAVVWQQIIKKLPLTLAYANKAVTVIWGLIWGLLFFGEKITPLKIAGALIVISGIALYAFSDTDKKNIPMADVIAEDSAEGVEVGGDGNE